MHVINNITYQKCRSGPNNHNSTQLLQFIFRLMDDYDEDLLLGLVDWINATGGLDFHYDVMTALNDTFEMSKVIQRSSCQAPGKLSRISSW